MRQQAAEGDIGMPLGVQNAGANPLEKIGEPGFRSDAAPERQGRDAVRNQVIVVQLELTGDGYADHQIGLAGKSKNERLKGGQQRVEERSPAPGTDRLELLVKVGVNAERLPRA